MATLYVDNLDPNVPEERLSEEFSMAGRVIKVSIERNSGDDDSPAFAYVTFEKKSNAEQALKQLNGLRLGNREIAIKWPEESSDSAYTHIDLQDNERFTGRASAQSSFTNVDIRRSTDYPSNRSNRAHSSIPDRRNQNQLAHSASNTNVFIKNFADSFNDDSLFNLLRKYGRIISCKVAKDEFGRSKGYGFCNFRTSESAEKAIEDLNGQKFNGLPLYVGFFSSKHDREASTARERKEKLYEKSKNRNLYIKNLDESIDDEALSEAFCNFGDITSAVVQKDSYGNSKGFGFVCYSTPDSAARAIDAMDGSLLRGKRIYVDYAQKAEDRQNLLSQRCSRSRQPGDTSSSIPNRRATSVNPSPGLNLCMPNNSSRLFEDFSSVRNRFDTTETSGAFPTSRMNALRTLQPVPNASNPTSLFLMASKPKSQLMNAPIRTPLTQAALDRLTPQERKEILGKRLFPQVHRMQPNLAEKITDTLLERDTSEILFLLRDPVALENQVRNIAATLKTYPASKNNNDA